MHLRNPRRSTPSSFVFFSMKSDILVFVFSLIGSGVPEHAPRQVHTDCDQELFPTSNERETTGNKCHECRYAFNVEQSSAMNDEYTRARFEMLMLPLTNDAYNLALG